MNIPVKDIPREKLDIVLYGTDEVLEYNYVSKNGSTRKTKDTYEGIITNLERRYVETKSSWIREWIEQFMVEMECPTCHGARLKPSVLSVLINKKIYMKLLVYLF